MWGRKAARVARAAMAMSGLGAALCLPAPANADSLVVRASGPSAKTYPPGRKLSPGASVALRAGDVVTLLDAKGTRTLRGPGEFPVETSARPSPAGNVMLSALLDTKRVRRARTGAVRGTVAAAPATPRRPNLWLADIVQSGPLCVANPAAVRLWRADTDKALDLRIADAAGAAATAHFAAGESITAWPAALPVRDGVSYRLSDDRRTSEIYFALMEDTAPDMEAVASGLISRQCSAQLDLLVETAAVAERGTQK